MARSTEKKVKTMKCFVIAQRENDSSVNHAFAVYTSDEWSYGKGYRYAEWECDSLQECIEWVQSC